MAKLFLGLDSSTQSLSAVVIDYDRRKVVYEQIAELRPRAAAVQNPKRRAAQSRSAGQTQPAVDVGRSAGFAFCRDEKGRRGAWAKSWPSAAAASSTARFISTTAPPPRWRIWIPGKAWWKICTANFCAPDLADLDGFLDRQPSAPKSAKNSAASRRRRSAPARTRSSGSPGRKSASFTRPSRRPMPKPPTSRWSVRSWRRCSPGKSRRLITATARG